MYNVVPCSCTNNYIDIIIENEYPSYLSYISFYSTVSNGIYPSRQEKSCTGYISNAHLHYKYNILYMLQLYYSG